MPMCCAGTDTLETHPMGPHWALDPPKSEEHLLVCLSLFRLTLRYRILWQTIADTSLSLCV